MPALCKLYFSWTARWKHSGIPNLPQGFPTAELQAKWTEDGLELLSLQFSEDRAFAVFAATPGVTPAFLAQRCKGRLDHAIREEHPNFSGFDRAFFLRTLGQNTREIVQTYIRNQVDASDLVDPLYRQRLKELRFQNHTTSQFRNSHAAVYDLYYHVIFITGGRHRMRLPEAKAVFQALRGAAAANESEVYDISIMPDHVHLLVGDTFKSCPESIVENLKKESGQILRRSAFWSGGGYIGSVGPYRLKTALDRNRGQGWVKEGW